MRVDMPPRLFWHHGQCSLHHLSRWTIRRWRHAGGLHSVPFRLFQYRWVHIVRPNCVPCGHFCSRSGVLSLRRRQIQPWRPGYGLHSVPRVLFQQRGRFNVLNHVPIRHAC